MTQEKSFEEIFGKSVFIEHLTEKQQEELFSILKEKCLIKENAKEDIEYFGARMHILNTQGFKDLKKSIGATK